MYANEVLDAFPVHVLVRTADGVKEAYVDERDGNGFGSFRVVCYAKDAPADGLRLFGTPPA